MKYNKTFRQALNEVRTGNSIEEVDFNINPKLKPID